MGREISSVAPAHDLFPVAFDCIRSFLPRPNLTRPSLCLYYFSSHLSPRSMHRLSGETVFAKILAKTVARILCHLCDPELSCTVYCTAACSAFGRSGRVLLFMLRRQQFCSASASRHRSISPHSLIQSSLRRACALYHVLTVRSVFDCSMANKTICINRYIQISRPRRTEILSAMSDIDSDLLPLFLSERGYDYDPPPPAVIESPLLTSFMHQRGYEYDPPPPVVPVVALSQSLNA